MTDIKAIIIDPWTRTIEHGTVKAGADGSYKGLVAAVFEGRPVQGYIEHVSVDGVNGVYVDEEGLLKDWSTMAFFRWGPQQLAGRGVVVGSNDEGDTVDVSLDIELVRRDVQFVDAKEVSIPAPTVTTFDGGVPKVEPLHGSFEPWTVNNQPTHGKKD